jgi:SAM-dependent methyltransferase
MDFDVTVATPLCHIMGHFGSDKGHSEILRSRHNYTTLYHHLFNTLREKPIRLFELGLGTNNVLGKPGASLLGWREYFPKGQIYGADIDKEMLFTSDRINTFYCDQTNPESIATLFKEISPGFHIIIDNGLHTFSANVCFFKNSIHKLNAGGYYIVEDISKADIPAFEEAIEVWKEEYPHTFTLITLPSVNTWDNSVLIIKGGEPDYLEVYQ